MRFSLLDAPRTGLLRTGVDIEDVGGTAGVSSASEEIGVRGESESIQGHAAMSEVTIRDARGPSEDEVEDWLLTDGWTLFAFLFLPFVTRGPAGAEAGCELRGEESKGTARGKGAVMS